MDSSSQVKENISHTPEPVQKNRAGLPEEESKNPNKNHTSSDSLHNLFQNGQVPLHGSSSTQSINTASTSNEMANDSQIENQKRVDVLYHLCVSGKNGLRHFFGDTPFPGTHSDISGSTQYYLGEDEPVISIVVNAVMEGKIESEGNTRENWREKPADFKPHFGFTVVVTGRQNITINSYDSGIFQPSRGFPEASGLRIHSKRLIDFLDTITDYNPIQRSGGIGFYNFDYKCFSGLLMQYAQVKDHYDNFLARLDDDHERQRLRDEFDIQDLEEDLHLLVEQKRPFAQSDEVIALCDHETAYDVAVLLNVLTPQYVTIVQPVLRKLQGPNPRIDFDNLWVIFKPGTVVYDSRGEETAYVVVSMTFKARDPTKLSGKDSVDRQIIEIWNLIYDGRFLTRDKETIDIERFENDHQVLSLPLVPSTLYDRLDEGNLRRQLERRGKKFLHLIKEPFAHKNFDHPRASYKGHVIIDPGSYESPLDDDPMPGIGHDEPLDSRGQSRFRRFHRIDMTNPGQVDWITPEHLFLTSAYLEGFGLATKSWLSFQVDGIDPDEPYQPIQQLRESLVVQNDEDLEILDTIIFRASAKLSLQADFIPGKGRGQVFLLHGPPGTGKTLTVECVANDTKRPLISITPADINRNPEGRLRYWFDLAAKWGAILLVDEADIFLERRTAGQYDRNSIVTIFLRTMEYYDGILFLTTNRPGQIDDSFISRITVPIQYEKFTQDQQRKVWERFFKRYEASGKIVVTSRAKSSLRNDNTALNGREIRNLFQNAIALANVEAEKTQEVEQVENGQELPLRIDIHHFEKGLERLKKFKGYLTQLHKKDENQRANLTVSY